MPKRKNVKRKNKNINSHDRTKNNNSNKSKISSISRNINESSNKSKNGSNSSKHINQPKNKSDFSKKKHTTNNITSINREQENSEYKKLKSKRLLGSMLFGFLLFFVLIGRIAYLQFVKSSWLKEKIYAQQTKNLVISPTRGTIYDSTGKELAVSAPVDTVTINPNRISVSDKNEAIATQKTLELKEKVAKAFSEIFSLDYNETLEKVKSTSSVETIARKIETDKIDKLKKWMKENDIYSGINIDEDTKRYYPYSGLASNLIGFCGDSNQGLEGLEYRWDSVLTGTQGKITTSQDANQDIIIDKDEKYIPAENGSNITLTLDVTIQTIAEKYLKQAVEDNNCGRGGNMIVMDPNNGDILAMANYPDYNLNDPFTPNSYLSSNWNNLSRRTKK